jgi:site-specific DNA-methyltransferase (adenine-specific)
MIDLIQGDCLEVMKTIKDKSIDAIITDPPYGTTACKWDSVIPFDLMWEQLNRIIKPNGAIVLFGSEPFSSALRMSNIKNYKYDWKWIKDKGSNFGVAKYRPINTSEDLIVFSNKVLKYKPQMRVTDKKSNRGGKAKIKESSVYGKNGFKQSYRDTNIKYPINCIKFNTPKHNDKRNGSLHPTQKPVDLMEYLIKTYTNEGETVLDFTMGSGSTMVACQNTNRNGIGIEKDKNYFEIAEKRIEENKYKLF